MNNEEEGFLQAISEQPADDTARLIYADWLEEHGQANRGQFIRLMVKLAAPNSQIDDVGLLMQEMDDLHSRHHKEWERPLRALGAREVYWRRGFLEKVVISPADFLARSAELFAAAPTLHEVHFTDLPKKQLDQLCRKAVPELRRITHLDLSDALHEPGDAAAIADSPNFSSLRSLNLTGRTINAADVRAIVGSPHLRNLSDLCLTDNQIGAEGVRSLAESPGAKKLHRLDLARCGIDARGVRTLVGSPYLCNLTELDLRGNSESWPGIEAIANSPHLRPDMRIYIHTYNTTIDQLRARGKGQGSGPLL